MTHSHNKQKHTVVLQLQGHVFVLGAFHKPRFKLIAYNHFVKCTQKHKCTKIIWIPFMVIVSTVSIVVSVVVCLRQVCSEISLSCRGPKKCNRTWTIIGPQHQIKATKKLLDINIQSSTSMIVRTLGCLHSIGTQGQNSPQTNAPSSSTSYSCNTSALFTNIGPSSSSA